MNNVLGCVQAMCRPAVCHRELLRLGQVQRKDLDMLLQYSQRCLLITRKLLMTSVIVSFLLGSAKYCTSSSKPVCASLNNPQNFSAS